MKYWFDITNTPHVHIAMALKNSLENDYSEFIFTVRDFSEIIPLISQGINGYPLKVIGSYAGKNKIKKAIIVLNRFVKIFKSVIDYDVSISMGSESAIWTSYIKNKPSVAFGDNDTAKQWTYGLFVDYAFFPNAIPLHLLEKQGLKNKLYLYNGFKEDIYISEYVPDKNFHKTIPFDSYILIRPENLNANYVNSNAGSITNVLLEKLSNTGYKIVFLPRYKNDREYAAGIKNIFIPEHPINGLDACYNAKAVLTGAGTLAREAACLGVPAISFYAGKQLLAVDKKMINDGWMYHSRDPEQIVSQIGNMKKRSVSTDRSKEVKYEVISKLKTVIEELLNSKK
jgi:uncharacterized protein